MNHFSIASLSRNPMIILPLQTMTFWKEAYQTCKINNERVSFSCLKENTAQRENVCESINMFLQDEQPHAPSEMQQRMFMCEQPPHSTGLRASSLGGPWGRHLSPSPSKSGNECFAGDRQSTVYTVTCEQPKKRKLWLYAFFQQSRKTRFWLTRSRS